MNLTLEEQCEQCGGIYIDNRVWGHFVRCIGRDDNDGVILEWTVQARDNKGQTVDAALKQIQEVCRSLADGIDDVLKKQVRDLP